MDEIERIGIRSEGLDPDDPAIVTAIDFVRWELSMLSSVNRSPSTTNPLDLPPVSGSQPLCFTPSRLAGMPRASELP